MTVPLPGGYADELMWHLSSCPTCRIAKIGNTPRYCSRGTQLISSTLKERHDEPGTQAGPGAGQA
jgi:hypothetical protein